MNRKAHLLLACLFASTAFAASPAVDELVERFRKEPMFWQQPELADEIAKAAVPSDLSALEPWLAHDDRHTRANTAYLFAKVGDRRGFLSLIAMLDDRSEKRPMRPIVGNGIHEAGADPSLARKPTAEQIARQITEDRYYAIHLLGRLRDPRAVDLLIPLLDKDENNYNVAWALGEIGDARAIPGLVGALSNDDPLVRMAAIGALEKLQAKQALPHLANMFNDPSIPSAGDQVTTVGARARKAADAIRRSETGRRQ